jgi:nitrous oxidase accessory protein NosD
MTYYGYPDVTACLIMGNQIGIRSTVHTTHLDVKGSNIVGNRTAAIEVKTAMDFECRGNYWGTGHERQIALSILDGRDQPGRGVVIYQDFQPKPIPNAECSLKIRKER